MDLGCDSLEALRMEYEEKEKLNANSKIIELKNKEKVNKIKITKRKENIDDKVGNRERGREKRRDENKNRNKDQDKKNQIKNQKNEINENQIVAEEKNQMIEAKNKNISGISGPRSFVRSNKW